MFVGFNYFKVKVYVGDGFKFFDDYKNIFDVIIIDFFDFEGFVEFFF